MFIPIVIDPFAFKEDRYVWQYQKYMHYSYVNKVPMITLERYKNDDTLFSDKFMENHQFEKLTEDQIKELDIYYIPEEIITSIVEEKGSRLSAQLFLLKNRCKELEHVLSDFLKDIENKYDEPIEAVLNWAGHYESIYYLGNKYDFSVISTEFSIRFPNYRPMCYFCFQGMIGQNEIKERWNEFKNSKISFRFFSKKELLALFLSDEVIDYIRLYDCSAEFEMGIAGHHPICTLNYAEDTFNDLELVYDVTKKYDKDSILFRPHPADPYDATYRFKNVDRSKSVILFINKCKRIATQGSSIIIEGMLWNRVVIGKSGVALAAFANDLQNNDDTRASEELLNFLLFCYFVPYELIFDPGYIKWRKTKPSEIEIFEYHLKFYLKLINIDSSILNKEQNEREKELLLRRKIY